MTPNKPPIRTPDEESRNWPFPTTTRAHYQEASDSTPPPEVTRPLTPHEHLLAAQKDAEARRNMRRQEFRERDPIVMAQRRLGRVVAGLVPLIAAYILYTTKNKAHGGDSATPPSYLLEMTDVPVTGNSPLLSSPVATETMLPQEYSTPEEAIAQLIVEPPVAPSILWVDNEHPITQQQIESIVQPKLVMILNTDPTVRLVRDHEKVDQIIVPDLYRMFSDAQAAGKTLFMRSAFRTIEEQGTIDGPSNFVAAPGSSHHHIGRSFDGTTPSIQNQVASYAHFEKTPESEWLQENAYKYGFVFPFNQQNNPDGIAYEPWHLTWIGKEAALRVHVAQLENPGLSVQEIIGESLLYPDGIEFQPD